MINAIEKCIFKKTSLQYLAIIVSFILNNMITSQRVENTRRWEVARKAHQWRLLYITVSPWYCRLDKNFLNTNSNYLLISTRPLVAAFKYMPKTLNNLAGGLWKFGTIHDFLQTHGPIRGIYLAKSIQIVPLSPEDSSLFKGLILLHSPKI